MVKKVLVVDDHESINRGVVQFLRSIDISKVESAKHCDEAYLKIEKASKLDRDPFDLVIMDLYFKSNYQSSQLKSGQELIERLYLANPELPVIVYSVEDNSYKVRTLMKYWGVKAYVVKSRTSEYELSVAIESVISHKNYLSPSISKVSRIISNDDVSPREKEIMKCLSRGMTYQEISLYLKKYNIKPSSVSSIEKCMIRMKDQFNAKTPLQLMAIFKDKKLI